MKINRFIVLAIIIALVIIFFLSQILWLRLYGKPVPAPEIPRETIKVGSGDKLSYVVMGDSTSISQGGEYDKGYAIATTNLLSQDYEVEMKNFGISGARTKDVLDKQLPQALKSKPNVVLIAIGANDTTHLTSSSSIEKSMTEIINRLIEQNCEVKIVITGSADMGAVPRIPQPLRLLAGIRAKQLNSVFENVAKENEITFAAIAEKTGPIFRQDKGLFAEDNFHPNDPGYKVWNDVLVDSVKEALENQPSHCKN